MVCVARLAPLPVRPAPPVPTCLQGAVQGPVEVVECGAHRLSSVTISPSKTHVAEIHCPPFSSAYVLDWCIHESCQHGSLNSGGNNSRIHTVAQVEHGGSSGATPGGASIADLCTHECVGTRRRMRKRNMKPTLVKVVAPALNKSHPRP